MAPAVEDTAVAVLAWSVWETVLLDSHNWRMRGLIGLVWVAWNGPLSLHVSRHCCIALLLIDRVWLRLPLAHLVLDGFAALNYLN